MEAMGTEGLQGRVQELGATFGRGKAFGFGWSGSHGCADVIAGEVMGASVPGSQSLVGPVCIFDAVPADDGWYQDDRCNRHARHRRPHNRIGEPGEPSEEEQHDGGQQQ